MITIGHSLIDRIYPKLLKRWAGTAMLRPKRCSVTPTLLLTAWASLSLAATPANTYATETNGNKPNVLEDFGLEVFEIDPSKAKERAIEARAKRQASLPDYMSIETFDADAALEAIDLNRPENPVWTAVESEVQLENFDSSQCCLQAMRSTRYDAEQRCLKQGHQVWLIESVKVQEQTKTPDFNLALCQVFAEHTPHIRNQNTSLSLQPKPNSVTYSCAARSLAQCFDPTGVNQIFAKPASANLIE